MGRVWAIGAVALVCAGGIAGCAEKGTTLPEVTSTRSVAASPSPTLVGGRAGVPPEAKAHTRAGAEAFIEYYIETVNLAWNTPDATLLRGLADTKCSFCKRLTATATELERSGERYAVSTAKGTNFGAISGDYPGEEVFSMSLREGEAQIVDSKGVVVRTMPASRNETVIGLDWTAEGWVLLFGERND